MVVGSPVPCCSGPVRREGPLRKCAGAQRVVVLLPTTTRCGLNYTTVVPPMSMSFALLAKVCATQVGSGGTTLGPAPCGATGGQPCGNEGGLGQVIHRRAIRREKFGSAGLDRNQPGKVVCTAEAAPSAVRLGADLSVPAPSMGRSRQGPFLCGRQDPAHRGGVLPYQPRRGAPAPSPRAACTAPIPPERARPPASSRTA